MENGYWVCYFAIDAPGSSSLCFAISGDCGRKKYILPPTNVYIRVAPGDGLIFLYQPSSDHIAWLKDGYEFEGPEYGSHAPGKVKLGLRTAADIFGSLLRPESYDSMSSTFTKKHFITRCATTLFRLPFPIALCQGGTTLRVRRMDPGTLLWDGAKLRPPSLRAANVVMHVLGSWKGCTSMLEPCGIVMWLLATKSMS